MVQMKPFHYLYVIIGMLVAAFFGISLEYGYHVYDSGLIRCHWVVRLPEHEEKSSCRTGYPQRRSSTTDRRSSHLAMLSTW